MRFGTRCFKLACELMIFSHHVVTNNHMQDLNLTSRKHSKAEEFQKYKSPNHDIRSKAGIVQVMELDTSHLRSILLKTPGAPYL